MNYTKESIDEIAAELTHVVNDAVQSLHSISDEDASRRPAPGKWTKKEIIGHLIDSATNNHQRFVRARQSDELVFPAYAQDDWVTLQQHNGRRWSDLLALWKHYNDHIAHVIRHIPEVEYLKACHIGSNKSASLAFLIDDYLVHLKHHMKAVL